MRSRLDSGLRDLNTKMISMGGLAEKAIRLADTALMEGDSKSAKEAMALQGEIRSKEKAIEQLCMKYLLLQAPMAQDLRTVSAALKMITDMSRICEIAGDMSEEILNMGGRIGIPGTQKMAEATRAMVSEAIDAFVKQDLSIARKVIRSDDVVDDLFNQTKQEIIRMIVQMPQDSAYAVDLVMIAKYYEKIGDHAVNIAKWVIYSITGSTEEGEE